MSVSLFREAISSLKSLENTLKKEEDLSPYKDEVEKTIRCFEQILGMPLKNKESKRAKHHLKIVRQTLRDKNFNEENQEIDANLTLLIRAFRRAARLELKTPVKTKNVELPPIDSNGHLKLEGVAVSSELLKQLATKPELKSLDFTGADTEEADMALLANFKGLKELNLSTIKLDNLSCLPAGLNSLTIGRTVKKAGEYVRSAKDFFPDIPCGDSLKELVVLEGHFVNDFSYLLRLPNLEKLVVRKGVIGSHVFRYLTEHNKIKNLQFIDCEGYLSEEITHLTQLKSLLIAQCKFANKEMVFSIPHLEILSLMGEPGRAFLFHEEGLKNLKNLQYLHLQNYNLQDDELFGYFPFQHIFNIPNLKVLSLSSCSYRVNRKFVLLVNQVEKLKKIILDAGKFDLLINHLDKQPKHPLFDGLRALLERRKETSVNA